MRNRHVVNWSIWGARYDYAGYHDCKSHCYLLINGNAVLVTEAWDNEGTSVTNMAEDIATRICRERGIPLDRLTWIEHYIHGEGATLRHTFDLTTFEVSDQPHFGFADPDQAGVDGKFLRHPHWSHLPPHDLATIFGRPLELE